MATPGSQDGVAALVDAVQAHVDYLRELGVEGLPWAAAESAVEVAAQVAMARVAPDVPAPPVEIAPPVERPAAPRAAAVDSVPTDRHEAQSADSLSALRTVLGDCQRCKLTGHRKQIVFGVGNPSARLVFVGEGPGADEDQQGEPFVGRAGQLLTEIITKGMGLTRDDVYICNVVKCRPPGNRNPEPDEVAACEPFLHRQIELIAPTVIVALGKFAAQSLLRCQTPISQLRGKWFDYRGVRLMPTFHPAYLLRNPGDKRLVWDDIKQVMAVLGIAVAKR